MAAREELHKTEVEGAFNPFVITPEWLAETEIIKDRQAMVRPGVLGQEVAFAYEVLEWSVSPSALVVRSSEDNDDCGDIVARVIERLPHTPMTLVTNGFSYLFERAQWEGCRVPLLGDLSYEGLTSESVAAVGWQGRFTRQDGSLVVYLAYDEEHVFISLDYARPVRATSIRDRALFVANAARQFRNDQADSRAVVNRLAGRGLLP